MCVAQILSGLCPNRVKKQRNRPVSFSAYVRSAPESAHESEVSPSECSFDAAVIGSYYGKQLLKVELDKRIGPVPYEPSALVWTAWDLGIRDATAIWFAQVVGREKILTGEL